ncbi:hypothetical protein ACFWJ2_38270 [Streptomyces tendae]|uniref:hypothetical protein n=1 Tax=Streptomyces tendae TaxID=1932 RepID=UPI00365FCE54
MSAKLLKLALSYAAKARIPVPSPTRSSKGVVMARHQFTVYELRVRPIRETKSYRRVAKFNALGADFREVYAKFLKDAVGAKGLRIDRGERYIRLQQLDEDHRIVWFTVESGRYGVPGKVVATETGNDSHEITDDEAASYPLRQALIVPTSGEYALWATEVVGHTSAISALHTAFKDWFRKQYEAEKLIVEINQFQDANSWNRFIEEASLEELVYVVHEQDSDRAKSTRTQEHRVKAGIRTRLPKAWIKRAMERELPADSVFSVQGLPEADEVRMQIERNGRSRTIVVGRDFPRFFYEIDGAPGFRPPDETFRSEVLSEVGASLEYMKVDARTWRRQDT